LALLGDLEKAPDVFTQPRPGAVELPPGEYFWGARANDRILVRLGFDPERSIRVDLWWNTVIGAPAITLCIGLYPESVEFGELLGNGFNHPEFHQKGFGTLVVNTAIQSLQSICPPATWIEGVLLNTEEDELAVEERNRLAVYRRIFWSRFGLDFFSLGPKKEIHLRGTVGALRRFVLDRSRTSFHASFRWRASAARDLSSLNHVDGGRRKYL
jgi:hypothetical protein